MKNVLKQLAKSVLIPLGLTAAASPTDAAIQKKKKLWTTHDYTDNRKSRNKLYYAKKKVSQRWFIDKGCL